MISPKVAIALTSVSITAIVLYIYISNKQVKNDQNEDKKKGTDKEEEKSN